VLRVPSAEVLDGLAQHPATRDLLGPRLGPTAVVIPEDSLDRFLRAVGRLGLAFDDPAGDATETQPSTPRAKLR
jgi:hypothetical protein